MGQQDTRLPTSRLKQRSPIIERMLLSEIFQVLLVLFAQAGDQQQLARFPLPHVGNGMAASACLALRLGSARLWFATLGGA